MNSSGGDLAALEVAVESLLSDEPGLTVTGAEARVVLARVDAAQRRLEAVRLAWVGASVAADTRNGVGLVGGKKQGAGPAGPTLGFITHDLREGPARAHADVEAAVMLAPRVGELRELGDALAAGTTTRAHVDVAVSAVAGLPKTARRDRRADVVEAVVAIATRFDPVGVKRAGAMILDHLHPTGTDRFDPDAHERRFLHLATDSTGMVQTRGQHDPVSGALLKAVVDALSDLDRAVPSPEGVDATAGDATLGSQDLRSPQMRRHDALVEVVRAGAQALADVDTSGRVGAALARVTVVTTPAELTDHDDGRDGRAETGDTQETQDGWGGTWDTEPTTVPRQRVDPDTTETATSQASVPVPGAADTATHVAVFTGIPGTGPISRGTLHRLVCDSVLDRLTMTGTGQVLAMTALVRLATPAITRALVARDGGCSTGVIRQGPGCSRPPRLCDAHHVTWWSRGGRTEVDNLTLLCTTHHTLVHTETWQLVMRDGVPWHLPPGCSTWVRGSLTDHLTRARHLASRLRDALDPGP